MHFHGSGHKSARRTEGRTDGQRQNELLPPEVRLTCIYFKQEHRITGAKLSC
ncbi:hypothetical protein DPMN_107857 [Dreissena polymorpha]|uniref:Uncharacterized protein n=1 Tax=Dreissena polymorpha TaxID=45954 RepID=A0A9D4K7P1_DREPO|nr:hypothetical protein DPMN_107857 [Dreissena polymorpha]